MNESASTGGAQGNSPDEQKSPPVANPGLTIFEDLPPEGPTNDSEADTQLAPDLGHVAGLPSIVEGEDLQNAQGGAHATNLLIDHDAVSRFEKEVVHGESFLRHLENVVGTILYPVSSTGVLAGASRLPTDAVFSRTLSLKGGLVPTFVTWEGRLKYYLPKKIVKSDAKVLGVYARGTRYPREEGSMAFFTMDRRVVLLKTARRTTQFFPPGEESLLPEGAVLSPCDLNLTEVQNDAFFEELLKPLTEEEMLDRFTRTFDKGHPFRHLNYFDVVPRGWNMSEDMSSVLQFQTDMALPAGFFPSKTEEEIMEEAIISLELMGILSPTEVASITDWSAVYQQLAADHPELLSCSAEALGSGFNPLAVHEEDSNSEAVLREKDAVSKTLSRVLPDVENGRIHLQTEADNFRYDLVLNPLQAVGGGCGADPVPLEWGALVHSRSSASLSRTMSILTTATKLNQGVCFVRAEGHGSVAVRLESAQPHTRSQNSTIRGGRAVDQLAQWMETRECRVAGEFWLPFALKGDLAGHASATPSLHALVRDARNLILTEIISSDLDPSLFGPVKVPFLAPVPWGHELNSLIGKDFDVASLVCPYYDHQGRLSYVNLNHGTVKSPVSPLYGLPVYVRDFMLRLGEGRDIERVAFTVVRGTGNSWDSPVLPQFSFWDKATNRYVRYNLPIKVNCTKSNLTAGEALASYENLAAEGVISQVASQYLSLGVTPTPASQNPAAPVDGASSDPTQRNVTPPTLKATAQKTVKPPPVKQPRKGGVTFTADGTKVATTKAGDGSIIVDKSTGLVWAGPFADCPPKKRSKWKEDLRLLTWLSGEASPNSLARVSIRKCWLRPLKRYQRELKVAKPNTMTLKSRYVEDIYDATTFQW